MADKPLIGHPLRRRPGFHCIEQRLGEAHVDLFRLGGEFEAVGLERGQIELRQIGIGSLVSAPRVFTNVYTNQ